MKRFLLCLIAIGSLAISCSEGKKNSPVFSDDIRLAYSQAMENRDRMGIVEWVDTYLDITGMFSRLDPSCLADTAQLSELVGTYFPLMLTSVDSLLGPTGSIVVPKECGKSVKNAADVLNRVGDSYLEMSDEEWSKVPDMIVGNPDKFMDFTPFDHIILSLLTDRFFAMDDKFMEASYARRLELLRHLSSDDSDDRVSVSLNAVGYRIVNGDTIQADTIGNVPDQLQ